MLLYRVTVRSSATEPTPDAGHSQLLPGTSQALLVAGQILPLPHPQEMPTLWRHGEIYLTATLKGRYFRVTHKVCLHCGRLFEDARVAFAPQAGCLPLLVILIAVPWWLLETGSAGTPLTLAGSVVGSALAVMLLCWALVRLLHARRRRALATRACPGCGSLTVASIAHLQGKTLPLTGRDATVSVTPDGVS